MSSACCQKQVQVMCQGEIMFRCPIQLISVTCLALHLSNSLILLMLRNSREEESTQQDWIFLMKRETAQFRRFKISNRYQIGTLSSF